MDDSPAATTYRLVFDGRLVPGRNAAQVEAEFVSRFGEKNTKTVFSGESVTIARGLSREDAQKKQLAFEQLGIVVQLVPSSRVTADLSLAETPQKPDAKPQQPSASVPPVEEPKKADVGVLPDRSPATGAKVHKSRVYSQAELADAFSDATVVPAASRSYLAKLIPVTALMLLLPIVYVAITLLAGAGTMWVAVEGMSWVTDRPSYFRLIGAVSGLLGMILLTLFLLRPLVARVDRGPEPVRLDPSREPILFELVDRITDVVGAPMPDEIVVSADANASAHLTRGAFSKGLTLTIGMPLIYGLDLQSLTGVLAHEFGHFTQRVGMRSSALVHQINYWFYRQIRERDSWDRVVDSWLEAGFLILSFAAMLARLGSFLVRLLLQLLSLLASLFSFSLSREMEYDADRYEIGLVGSSAYQKTAIAMRLLDAGHQLAVADVSLAFDSDKKVDNLPKLAALKASSFTDEDRQAIMASIEEINTSMFDSHPSDQQRIRKAVEADAPARFVHTGSAKKLLREPDRLSKLVTLQWYRSFGVDVAPDDLIPLDEFASETKLLDKADKAIRAYFGDLAVTPQYLPLLTPGTLAKLDDAQLRGSLRDVKEQLAADKNEFMLHRKQLDEAVEYQFYYRQAHFWRRAGFPIDLNAYRLPLTTDDVSEITAKLSAYKKSENKSRAALQPCAELQGRRVSCGLEMACRNGEIDRNEVDTLRRAYAAMAAVQAEATKLNECGERIDLLLQVCEALPDEVKYLRQLKTERATIQRLQRLIRTSLGSVADPFSDGAALSDELPNEYTGPDERETVVALDDAARILRSLGRTSDKLLGRMCEVALQAEQSDD